MSPVPTHKKGQGHGHKVVFLYASHTQILLPSTFRLLVHRSNHDAILKAFIESAYRALRNEHDAAAQSVKDSRTPKPALPKTFEKLSEPAHAATLRAYTISLTTIAQVGIVLSSRQDFREAMQSDFAAIWDPESFLAIAVLRKTDVTDTLELIAKAIEVIRLGCWLDAYLDTGNAYWPIPCKQRLTIRGQEDAIARFAERRRSEGTPFEQTLGGYATGIAAQASIKEIRLLVQDYGQEDIAVIERSTIPVLDEGEWTFLKDLLGPRLKERRIRVKLTSDPTSQLECSSSGYFHINLGEFLMQADAGRSQTHFDEALQTLREQVTLSRIYAPSIEMLLLGGDTRDSCAMRATRVFDEKQLPFTVVKLLNLLYPKDSHRYGDEPVNLSRVQGNPCQQVAIVGMSCRVPGANDADELWKLLKEGKDMCQEIPTRLYRYQDYHSASYRERNVMRVKTGNFVECSSLFDRSILGQGVSVEDCVKMDPQQRLAILTTQETLQSAGYGFSPYQHPKKPEQWSTHLAYCSDDYREHLSQNIEANFVSNTHRAHLVAKVNETFGFRGEACTYDTACSSALVAVEAACNSLLAGETSAVLTGGVNILTQPQITIGLDRGFFLSASSQCMSLDDAGSGYSRADAVSIMMLKRLPDAVRDGDPILGVISSAAANHSGESFSITHPHGPTQKRLYQAGMLASKTLPEDFTYIEMHGTGTQSGDFEEVGGIVETFGNDKRGEASPLVLSSVKANIGHSEAASGASSMIKTLKIYEHGEVPRHIGIRTKLNTKLPPLFGLHVPLEETKLDRVGSAFTLVDNFSAAGGNSSIVMDRGSVYRQRLLKMSRDADQGEADSNQDSRPVAKHHLLFVTAATPFSLDAKRRRLVAFLEANMDVSLTEFCSAVSLSDPMYPYRLMASPASLAEVKTCLSSQESVSIIGADVKRRQIGIVFSGQGAQYMDMSKEVYEHSAAFRNHVDSCNTIALSLGLPNLVEVIHPPKAAEDAAQLEARAARKADSFSPAQYQLALIATEVGMASMLRDWGLQPSCVVGHSLGEYTALWLSGVISLRSLIELVGRRAMLMMELCEPNASSMLAVREGPVRVRQLLEASGYTDLEIACFNSPNDTVVAGRTDRIGQMLKLCEQQEPKIKAMSIPVPYAFHSRAVEPLMQGYGEVTARHRISSPKINIASNVLGQVVAPGGSDFDAQYLVQHLRQPVRFAESIADLQYKLKVDTWIEIGPHPTCIPMLKGCYTEAENMPDLIPSFRRGSSSWTCTLDLVKELASGGIDLDWSRAFGDLGLRFPHHELCARLPLYPFDLEEYRVPFKDRGLRDHLMLMQKEPKSTSIKSERQVAATARQRWPKPMHALLWQCVKLEAQPPSALFLARVNQRPFRDFIQGHIILGVPLAPATVFVELAQEAGMYWWRMDPCSTKPTGQLEEDVVIEVFDLSMVASLYLNEHDAKQSIEVSMQGNPTSKDGSIVQFFSHSKHQHQKNQYGSCRIKISTQDSVAADWTKLRHLILTTASAVKSQPASVMRTDTIYRTFEAIVLYLDGFRGMNTIWMTERGDEAVSEVMFNAEAINGRFLCSPMLLDSLGGLTGFISNVGFAEGPFVYMAETIGRIATMPGLRKLQPGSGTKVHVYARMEQDKDLSKGSAYFFLSDGQLMGTMEGIAFKRIRRDMLSRLVQLSLKAFASEAARAAQEKSEHPGRQEASNSEQKRNAAGQQSYKQADVSQELKVKTAASCVPARLNEARCDSPMDVLTNPNRRFTYSAPLHMGGPQLKRFDDTNVLFLFPDGSGTAQIYPKIDIEMAGSLSVYGLDSPYLGQVEAWSRGVAELVDRYIEMLCRVRSRGPFKLAGWSIGGVVALEVARRLLSVGQEVAFLGLIDTPNPNQIKPLPTETLDYMLKKIRSSTVREHFRSCALSLPEYRCQPLQAADRKPSKVVVINAADSSKLEGVMADKSQWRSFWSDSARLVCEVVTGDHWTCLEAALNLVVSQAK
ncbi:related to polyketide synthase [Ustilago bromivora]|uniref:Related to polyketide synthase n=1 Tax=Ustilago bromivora TaxID=307758 RepID=A0A1K0GEF0_9BASI|nr:related to polyketide synthase [Ustilago bromivora]SYW77455.1 related to polyketide synthase [Ustilago bromivora]